MDYRKKGKMQKYRREKSMKKWVFFICLVFIALAILSLFFDEIIIKNIVMIRNLVFDYFFSAVTVASSTLIVLVFLLSLFYYRKRKIKWVLPILGASILSFVISIALKIIVNRQRPFSADIVKISEFGIYMLKNSIESWNTSFPSFDTMIVFAMLPIVMKEFRRFGKYWMIFAFLVGFSRLYFGVHYLSDVIAGGVIGFAIGLLIVRLEDKYKFGEELKRKKDK